MPLQSAWKPLIANESYCQYQLEEVAAPLRAESCARASGPCVPRWRGILPRVKRSLAWLTAIVAAGVAASSPASANGRFPAAGQVAVDPSDSEHIVLRTTYGILQTTDGGTTW